MTRVLENNLNPAECFIEVLNTPLLKLIPLPIDRLEDQLDYTLTCRMIHTIAIFKIRMKPQ